MECWATDIGNAYLESYTKEKVYIVTGPEFGEREGHTLMYPEGHLWSQKQWAQLARNDSLTYIESWDPVPPEQSLIF